MLGSTVLLWSTVFVKPTTFLELVLLLVSTMLLDYNGREAQMLFYSIVLMMSGVHNEVGHHYVSVVQSVIGVHYILVCKSLLQ